MDTDQGCPGQHHRKRRRRDDLGALLSRLAHAARFDDVLAEAGVRTGWGTC